MVITSFPSDREEPDDPRHDEAETPEPPEPPGASVDDSDDDAPPSGAAPAGLRESSDPSVIRISAEPLPTLPTKATPPAKALDALTPRLFSLDALRGLAILLMCLSGLLPQFLPNWMYHGYHPSFLPGTGEDAGWVAVENPSQFRGQAWPGFTWVDWVFPMFLFAMGAAIPLAMHARRMRGDSCWALLRHSVGRFFVLVGFAVYVQQIVPHHLNPSPTLTDYWLTVLGLFLLLPILVRLPKQLPRGAVWATRALGVLAAVVYLAAINDAETNPPFTWNSGSGDVDIIILLLAWASLVASLLWLVTRGGGWLTWTLRLLVGLSLAFVAHHQGMIGEWRVLGDRLNGIMPYVQDAPQRWLDLRWVNGYLPGHLPENLLDLSPLYNFTWLKFLWVVIPGTVIGDLVVRHLQEQRDHAKIPRPAVNPGSKALQTAGQLWGFGRHVLITAALLVTMLAVLYGLKDYATSLTIFGDLTLDTPYAAVLLGLPPLVLALVAMLGKPGPNGRYLRRLTLWGTGWLTAGLLLAVLPNFAEVAAEDARWGATYFEGGIGKGPPARLSWYLVSLGMSILLLTVLAVWIDVREWRRPFGLLIANGQNPILAYAGVHAVLAAVVALPLLMAFVPDGLPTSADGLVAHWIKDWHGESASPWHDAGWDVAKTLLLATVVWAATKRRLVLRA